MLAFVTPMLLMAQSANLKEGLVAYYPFDSDANDASGNGNNGTVKNATLSEAAHIGSGCYQFKGFDSKGLIRVKNNNTMRIEEAASFSFWWYCSSLYGMDGYGKKSNKGKQAFFAKNFDRGQINIGIEPIAEGKSFRVVMGANSQDLSVEVNNIKMVNRWHHLVCIYHKNYLKIYLDGKQIGQKNYNGDFTKTNNSDLVIGGIDNGWYPFNGKIDEFRMYNRVLNEKEIQALYDGITDTKANIVFQPYKFSDNEEDYMVFEDRLHNDINNSTYCESTGKLYLLVGKNTVIEYDLTMLKTQNTVKRTKSINLPFNAGLDYKVIAVSPNGKYLAFVDENREKLHIVDILSGDETASAKLGDKFDNYYTYKDGNIRSVGCPFEFQSNNEVLVSGMASALLFNVETGKSKKISFPKPYKEYVKCCVTNKGKISGYTRQPNLSLVTFEVSQGKIIHTTPNLCYFYEDDNQYSFSKFSNPAPMETGHINRRTGELIDDMNFWCDGNLEYKFKRVKYDGGNAPGLTLIRDDKSCLVFPINKNQRWDASWLTGDYGEGYFSVWGDRKLRIFNHSLTANEMEKQLLLSIIDSKDVDAFDEFINSHKNSKYYDIARQKRTECVAEEWRSLSKPANYTIAHYKEVKQFIDKYGATDDVEAARKELANIYEGAYENLDNYDVQAIDQYILNFPQSPYINKAKQKQKQAYKSGYDALCLNKTLQPYLDYVENNPNSPYLDAAKERARIIKQKEDQEAELRQQEETRRKNEEIRLRNQEKLNCVGRTIYWDEKVTFDIGSGGKGLLGTLLSNALGTNRVSYNVRYTAIVESTLGETAVKCVISNAEIMDPSWASANYIKYKSQAMSSINSSLGQTRVKQVNEFELK